MSASTSSFSTSNKCHVLHKFLEEVNHSDLHDSVKSDVNKVISCFLFIVENHSYIQWAVDNQDNTTIYENERDARNHVMRDLNGTSFHLHMGKISKDNTQLRLNGEEYITEIERTISQLAAIIIQLPDAISRLEFAEEFEYDHTKGCLDARVRAPIDWATTVLLSPLDERPFDFLMQNCVKKYKHPSIPFDQFAQNYFKDRAISTCIYEGKKHSITQELIRNYAIMLGYLPDTEKQLELASTATSSRHSIENNIDAKTLQSNLSKDQLEKLAHQITYFSEDTDYFIGFIEKIPAADLAAMLLLPDPKLDGATFLHNIIRNTSADAVVNLIKTANQDAIRAAMRAQPTNDATILRIAAARYCPKVFISLIQAASQDILHAELMKKNQHAWTLLHITAYNQSVEGLIALLNACDPSVINAALMIKNSNNETPLLIAARSPYTEKLFPILKVANQSALDATLVSSQALQFKFLRKCIFNHNAQVLLTCIKVASQQALSHACCNDADFFEMAMLDHSSSTLAALLNAIDDKAFVALLNPLHDLVKLARYIIYDSNWQTESLLTRVFAIYGKNLTTYLNQAWFQGVDLALTVMRKMQPFLTSTIHDSFLLQEFEKYWRETLTNQSHASSIINTTIYTTMKEAINLQQLQPDDILKIWHHGLYSVIDYRLLKKLLPADSLISQVTNDLAAAGLLFIGCHIPFDATQYSTFNRYPQALQRCEALLKIVKPYNQADFVKQLENYYYRPKLRININKKYCIHKLALRENKIIIYKHTKRVKEYLSTKKQSCTYIASTLNTAVFGEHDPTRSLVGYLFDGGIVVSMHSIYPHLEKLLPNQYLLVGYPTYSWQFMYIDDDKIPHLKAIDSVVGLKAALANLPVKSPENMSISEKEPVMSAVKAYVDIKMNKALFASDTGTYTRGWVGSDQDVFRYQHVIRNISFTSYDAFRTETEAHPHRLNELLRKVTRGSLCAVVYRTNTAESRRLARQYRDDILQTFNINLPIVYYDPLLCCMTPYTLSAQIGDIYGYNLIRHQEETFLLNQQKYFSLLNEVREICMHFPILLIIVDKLKEKIDAKEITWQAAYAPFCKLQQLALCQLAINRVEQCILNKPLWKKYIFGTTKTRPRDVEDIINFITLHKTKIQNSIYVYNQIQEKLKQLELPNSELKSFRVLLMKQLTISTPPKQLYASQPMALRR